MLYITNRIIFESIVLLATSYQNPNIHLNKKISKLIGKMQLDIFVPPWNENQFATLKSLKHLDTYQALCLWVLDISPLDSGT